MSTKDLRDHLDEATLVVTDMLGCDTDTARRIVDAFVSIKETRELF